MQRLLFVVISDILRLPRQNYSQFTGSQEKWVSTAADTSPRGMARLRSCTAVVFRLKTLLQLLLRLHNTRMSPPVFPSSTLVCSFSTSTSLADLTVSCGAEWTLGRYRVKIRQTVPLGTVLRLSPSDPCGDRRQSPQSIHVRAKMPYHPDYQGKSTPFHNQMTYSC